jgi:hypothetical protein
MPQRPRQVVALSIAVIVLNAAGNCCLSLGMRSHASTDYLGAMSNLGHRAPLLDCGDGGGVLDPATKPFLITRTLPEAKTSSTRRRPDSPS